MDEVALINLFKSMTLEEKLGQMSQTTGEYFVGEKFPDELVVTGPSLEELGLDAEQLYTVGSVLGVSSTQAINAVQRDYLEKSRLKIPLMFMHDAIHGYRTIFPIPLALASTFDKEIVEEVGKLTAQELRSSGIQVDFSPMVDLVRDARWGRVMESFGEDAYLSGVLGGAMIEGYQGSQDGWIDSNGVVACLKHFAAYGAPDGGRDYASVDMSTKEFFGAYAKPYELALGAAPKMVMASFNSLNGEPATASTYLLDDVLRKRFGFNDLIISDWGAVSELKNHGVALDDEAAGRLALNAGIEIEMVSNAFLKYGEHFTKQSKLMLKKIDHATLKILYLKNELGLFEHPFADEMKEKSVVRADRMIESARNASKASCVLLKNDNEILPMSAIEPILIVGPFAKTKALLGNWNCKGRLDETISVEEGFSHLADRVFAYEYLDEVPEAILAEVTKVIVTIGEVWDRSGEGHSSANLEIPSAQQALIYDIKALGKKVIGIGFSGRPMALESVIDALDGLLWSWYLGNEAGNAIATLMLGLESPTGRLPMSFPRVTGQTPLSYNELRSGRPANESTYSSRYQDVKIGALYPFGYGLRYGTVQLTNVQCSDTVITDQKVVNIQCDIENDSAYDTQESVLLFMEDPVAKLVRPVRELIDFKKVVLKKGEKKTLSFSVSTDSLSYYNNQGEKTLENGKINFYINDLSHLVASIEVKNEEEHIQK